jgi:hypothetical protein
MTPTVQKDSLVMNALVSLDTAVVNLPEGLDSPVGNTPGRMDFRVMNVLESRQPGLFYTALEIFCKRNYCS